MSKVEKYYLKDIKYVDYIEVLSPPNWEEVFFTYKGKDYCGYWGEEDGYPDSSWFISYVPEGYVGVNNYEVVFASEGNPAKELQTARIFDGKTLEELWDDIEIYEI